MSVMCQRNSIYVRFTSKGAFGGLMGWTKFIELTFIPILDREIWLRNISYQKLSISFVNNHATGKDLWLGSVEVQTEEFCKKKKGQSLNATSAPCPSRVETILFGSEGQYFKNVQTDVGTKNYKLFNIFARFGRHLVNIWALSKQVSVANKFGQY